MTAEIAMRQRLCVVQTTSYIRQTTSGLVLTTMSEKKWVCPCNGCKAARKQAFQEIEAILENNKGDMLFAWHEVAVKINQELHPPKKDKK